MYAHGAGQAPAAGQFQPPPPPPPSRGAYQGATKKKNILDMTYDEYMESWNSMKLAVALPADGTQAEPTEK